MREAWVQLGEYMDKGVFRLPRRSWAEGRKRRARKPRAAPAPRAPMARQRAAVLGKDFEDEGWRVLDVKWPSEYSGVVVFYYDVEDADEELKAIDATDDFECCGFDAVGMSTLSEVVKWIKGSVWWPKGAGEGRSGGPRSMASAQIKLKHIKPKHIYTKKWPRRAQPLFLLSRSNPPH